MHSAVLLGHVATAAAAKSACGGLGTGLLTLGTSCVVTGAGHLLGGAVSSAASAASNGFLSTINNAIWGWVADAITNLGTLWLKVPSPSLDGSGSGGAVNTTGTPYLNTVLSYCMWGALAICIAGLIIAGVRLAMTTSRPGAQEEHVQGIGSVLFGTILVSGAFAAVAGLLSASPDTSGMNSTVAFLRVQTWWLVLAAAGVSVVYAGARMAWENRAEPGRQLFASLLRLLFILALGVPALAGIGHFVDAYSPSVVSMATNCNVGTSGDCFKHSVANMLGMTAWAGGGPATPSGTLMSTFTAIVLGLFAGLTSFIQMILMLARSFMLILLTGLVPVASAFTNTEWGMTWFKRFLSWTIAFMLYKPVAALIYAASFRLIGTPQFATSGLMQCLIGVAGLILSVFALPALMKLASPLSSAVAGGGGAAMGAIAAAAPAMGAVSIMSRSSSGAASGGGSSSTTSAPSGATPTPSGGMPGSSPAGSGGSPSGGAPSGAMPTGGAAAGGASAGGSAAAGGGAMAAAGGPVGVGVAAAQGAAQAAGNVARGAAEQAGGDA